MDDRPLTLGVLEKGEFTKKFNSLREGDCFYIRGPYGKRISIAFGRDVVLVGGGCGIAGLTLLAKRASKRLHHKRLVILLGAKDKNHIPYGEKLKEYGEVYVATEDGSLGLKGKVIDLFRKARLIEECYFFNCGSEAMVEAVMPLELQISGPEMIYSSLDYMTKCGVGLCGSCTTKVGKRLCVDGPFICRGGVDVAEKKK
jgi:dihydroorotate dehydrogenase (NAD+) catalytic subunit